MRNGSIFELHVSEIHVKQNCVNQGVDVLSIFTFSLLLLHQFDKLYDLKYIPLFSDLCFFSLVFGNSLFCCVILDLPPKEYCR